MATQQRLVDTAWASLGGLWSGGMGTSGPALVTACPQNPQSHPSLVLSLTRLPHPLGNCWVPRVRPLLTWVSQNLRGSLRPLLADDQDV